VGALPKELTLTAEIQSFLLEYEKAIRPLFESYPVSGFVFNGPDIGVLNVAPIFS